ncbi:hypothetical protein SCHPADRAFT_992456 [Schizopora paradoxa]|uniref:BTB domain-containing protein n=1 Tax=Schizopora paradoxa TaxID=27342 RepID=A0A0H2SRU8_9AGAM|nr:hypothetical protein SCHPADRAFT_992456 [Schizopora paradoxa]
MARTLAVQIRDPYPSYNDAVSLSCHLEESTIIVSHHDMSTTTANSFKDAVSERPRRHEKYYIATGDAVDNTLFRVHQYFFTRESTYFQSIFSSANFKSGLIGTSDAHPIIIYDAASTDFARLLWIFYNDAYSYDASDEVWCSVLRIAHKWRFDKVKALAASELEKVQMSPVDKAILARDCELGDEWLVTAYAELGARERPLTKEEGQKLGIDAVIYLAEVREKIRDRRARPPLPPLPPCFPPPIVQHNHPNPPWQTPFVPSRGIFPPGDMTPNLAQFHATSRPSVMQHPVISRSPSRSSSPIDVRSDTSAGTGSPGPWGASPIASRQDTITPPPTGIRLESNTRGPYPVMPGVNSTARAALSFDGVCGPSRGNGLFVHDDIAIVREVFEL